MHPFRPNLLHRVILFGLLLPASAGAEPIPIDSISPLARDVSDITEPLDPAAPDPCISDIEAAQAAAKFKSCPAFARDPSLGYVPPNWGLLLTGADLLAALPEVGRTSARAGAGSKACVIDTGLRLENNPGAGPDLLSQNTGRDARAHGTHVAGIVSSAAYGVNPALKTVVLSTPQVTEGEITKRLDEAAANPDVGVINLSFAIPDGGELTSAIKRAIEAGKWVVIAAGNRGEVNDPDAKGLPEVEDLPGVFIVGASSPAAGMPSHFSNHGPHVDFYAPGSQIDSLNARANPGYQPEPGDVHLSGTSMAAPHATGVIATLKNLDPRLTAEEVKWIIETTGIKRGPPPGITHLNPLLAAETVKRMLKDCPKVRHQNPTHAEFKGCTEDAIKSIQEAEPEPNGSEVHPSVATCKGLESEYARLRRAYFISQGGASASENILAFLAPLGRPAPPSSAENLWFTPATPISGTPEQIQAWTDSLVAQLGRARAITPLSDDLIHARKLLAHAGMQPGSLTPTEKLKMLPARKESVADYLEICTPAATAPKETVRFLAYPCTSYLSDAPIEFKKAFYQFLESQVISLSSSDGISQRFLEVFSTDERWLAYVFRDFKSGYRIPDPILDHIQRRSRLPPALDRSAQILAEIIQSARTQPAPQGSPALNLALLHINYADSPLKASERLLIQNDLRTLLAICKANPGKCLENTGGPVAGQGQTGSTLADQNLAAYQEALKKRIVADPALAREIAGWIGEDSNQAEFRNLFGGASPLIPAILFGQRPDDIPGLTGLARSWATSIDESVRDGTYCASGGWICDPASDLARQLEEIASKSPSHARVMRKATAGILQTSAQADSPQGEFRRRLQARIAASETLGSREMRQQSIQALQEKYRYAGNGKPPKSSDLRDEAGPLLEDPAILPIYLELARRELAEMPTRPGSSSFDDWIYFPPQVRKELLPETLDAVFSSASQGANVSIYDLAKYFGDLARDHSSDSEFIKTWFAALKKHQAEPKNSAQSQLLVTAALSLAQTEAGSFLLKNDPAFLAEWTRAFKHSEISGYILTSQTKQFPEVLVESLASSLPEPAQLAAIDTDASENGWIKTLFQSGMSHEPLLDLAIAAYEKCPESSLFKATLRQAIAEGLSMHPSRIAGLASPGGVLMQDSELRQRIWGEVERPGGTNP